MTSVALKALFIFEVINWDSGRKGNGSHPVSAATLERNVKGFHTEENSDSFCVLLGQDGMRAVDAGGRHPLTCPQEKPPRLRGSLEVVGPPSAGHPKLRPLPWPFCSLNHPLVYLELRFLL